MSRQRLSSLRAIMRRRGCGAFIVSRPAHIRALSGFSGSHALCIIRSRGAEFLTDGRYALQSREEVRGFRRTVVSSSLIEASAGRSLLGRIRRAAFEEEHLSHAQVRAFRRHFPGIRFVPTAGVLEGLLVRKTPPELASIREAARIADAVFGRVVSRVVAGAREADIASEISYLLRRHGADGDAFEPIVASGWRGALPHARPTSRKIRSGDLVILDFGCRVDGYCSDLTRTLGVGRLPERARKLHRAVLDAQTAAIEAARGGMAARELDMVARKRLKHSGFAQYVVHSLGHGLGLEVHEIPRVSWMSDECLEAGSVITIEPGLYVPGFGGVRIEDDILLLEDGCEVLTRAPRDLTIT
ncbi:MAG: aminopeptidase P family protein [Bacteroidota bacterium]